MVAWSQVVTAVPVREGRSGVRGASEGVQRCGDKVQAVLDLSPLRGPPGDRLRPCDHVTRNLPKRPPSLIAPGVWSTLKPTRSYLVTCPCLLAAFVAGTVQP